VPWFPFKHPRFGEYARHAAVPAYEERNGIRIEHPRYLLLPKVGMNSAPHFLARTGLAAAKRLIASGYDFDFIDAHYFYPDGVAATIIGKALKKPVVITARGTDINLIPNYEIPRRMILEAARACAAVVAVSAALKDRLVALGVDQDKIHVLRNGVDLDLFMPRDREAARADFGISCYAVASVGNLIPLKGHDIVIRAIAAMPDVELLIAGSGPDANKLVQLAESLGVSDRVRLLGLLSQEELCTLYSAVDCLVLASAREGCPNVLLEAMACGTPVVATKTGGIPEIVTIPEAGELMTERSVAGLMQAVRELRSRSPSREIIRAHARTFDWHNTTSGQLDLFAQVCRSPDSDASTHYSLREQETT
jgi:glycosyltransferase involved in cell wall biosynthesis